MTSFFGQRARNSEREKEPAEGIRQALFLRKVNYTIKCNTFKK